WPRPLRRGAAHTGRSRRRDPAHTVRSWLATTAASPPAPPASAGCAARADSSRPSGRRAPASFALRTRSRILPPHRTDARRTLAPASGTDRRAERGHVGAVESFIEAIARQCVARSGNEETRADAALR